MTVRELIEMLEDFPEDAKVVSYDSSERMSYCYSIGDVRDGMEVSSFYGNNFPAVVIDANRQIGMVHYSNDGDDYDD